jgi:hypothetical protein
MLSCHVRGNWRDLLVMTRAASGVQNEESGTLGDRASDRNAGSAMIDPHEGFPLRFTAALPAAVGR